VARRLLAIRTICAGQIIAMSAAGTSQIGPKTSASKTSAATDEKLQGLIAGAILLVGGALVAFAGLVVLLEGGAAILARWIPTWASLLIVGAVIVLIGGLTARGGLAKLSIKNITPDRTAANLSKDARIMKEHL